MKKYLLLTLFLVITSSFVVTAQQQKPALQPSSDRQVDEAPTKMLLEVSYNPAMPPASSTINGAENGFSDQEFRIIVLANNF